jgi:hypothetical protein
MPAFFIVPDIIAVYDQLCIINRMSPGRSLIFVISRNAVVQYRNYLLNWADVRTPGIPLVIEVLPDHIGVNYHS